VLCQASPRQSSSNEPSSRGMHQSPPNPRAQISAEPSSDPYAYHVRAKYQGASPEPQTSSHSSQPGSPRDTPSVESFTQSQLGDDERSEESEPSSRTNPPRTSSLFLRHGQRDPKISQSVQHPVAIGDNAPIFLQETPSAESYIGSPKEIHTPRSTTSSNQTPTQATFTDPNLLATLPGRPDPVEQSISRQATREELAAYDGQRPRRLSSPQSRFSSPVPYSPNDRAATPTNRNALEMGSPQKPSSGDSKSTIRNVTGEKGLNESPGTSPKSSSLRNADLNLVSRAPARMNALAASEVSSTVTDAHRDGAKRPISSPVSSARDSLVVPRPSEDRSIRGPSIDSLPSRIDLDRPPSPVSPYQYSSREPPERRGRPGPIHYGLGHDFVPDSEHHNRSRSRSYSNARLSQDSHRPSIHEYSAFRGSSDASPHPYPGRSSRDHSPMLRQQAPDYQIEAVKFPIEWPSENQASEGRSRSRRGSRSSAFFKSLALGSSSKTEEPPLPNSPDNGVSSPPVDSPTPGDRKSKRSSVFRSLTGNSGSGSTSAQSKENVAPNGSKSERTQPVQSTPPPPPPQVEDDEFPSRGNSRSAASKFSKRLQRSSTSGNPGQESGKKKRFSGFGVSVCKECLHNLRLTTFRASLDVGILGEKVR